MKILNQKYIQGFSIVLFLLLASVETGYSADSTSFIPANVTAEVNAGGVPVGTVIAWSSRSLPPAENGVQKWAECNGRRLSRAAYPELFAQIGTQFGGWGASFYLPDLRGEFVRGWDHGREVDAGRGVGTYQGDAIRNIKGSATVTGSIQGPLYYKSVTSGAIYKGSTNMAHSVSGDNSGYGRSFEFDASRVVPTADENRPRNMALMFLIRILP